MLFLYNPFFRPVVEKLVSHLSNNKKGKLWVVYCNPVSFDVFDESGVFSRYYAALHKVPEDERRSVHHSGDSVVIYQSADAPMVKPKPGANAPVRVTVPNYGADVEPME